MDYLDKNAVRRLFAATDSHAVYQKQGEFLVRPAMPGETVITLVSGKVETLVGAKKGDWVVQNVMVGTSAERYIPPGEKFHERYDVSDKVLILEGSSWFMATAKGQITGGFYNGHTVSFEAPWGADMLLENGDFLGTPFPLDDPDDIYRVARQEFIATYGTKPAFTREMVSA